MEQSKFDVLVIGAGPGGYVAAIRAAQLGFKTAIVEREHLGGICLNWGCIPTKALLRCSEINHLLHHLDEYGFSVSDISFDLTKIVTRSRGVAKTLSNGIGYLMKKNKITVIEGDACLKKKMKDGLRQVGVTGKKGKALGDISAQHIIIATGARARALPGLEPDGKLIWTYKEAMVPKRLPKSMLVVGSGAIGIEFASFYASLGSNVTVVEVIDRILPVEDDEISAFALKAFKAQGMTLYTSASVTALKAKTNKVEATLNLGDNSKQKKSFERVILAVGITGNVEGLGLEELGVPVEKGHIVIDEWGGTGVQGLYAIGDVAGPPWLAHKASHEGVICVERIAGIQGLHPLETKNIPGCTYCRPQIASIGLTEKAAVEAGFEVRVGRFPYQGNGKAIAMGEAEGLIKTVFDTKTGELLGAHMIGAEVTELIQGFSVAKTLETTEQELMHSVFPHPTLSEMMHESVLDAYGQVIHS